MPHFAPKRLSLSCKLFGALAVGVLLTACAQTPGADYYDTSRENTEDDAQRHARARDHSTTPGQLQFGFGQTGEREQARAAEAEDTSGATLRARPVAEAKTFLGTLPCMTASSECSAARLTLTMAPDGQWRSRTVFLDQPAAEHHIVQAGCWEVVGREPWRIILQTNNEASFANLTFMNDNLLRVNRINDITPRLEYRLTRQADVDAINEWTGGAANCSQP